MKKLVQLHGSNINVHTEEGKGSVFFFQLSLPKGIKGMKIEEINLDSLNDLHILLAEENAINAMVLVKLLAKYGIHVDVANDGAEAIERSNHKAYDVILMDIHMPEVDGFEAGSTIKSTINPNQKTPIYALTADITASTFDQEPSPFTGFLLKPIEQDKLIKALLSI
ncbi:MAG: CheY-like chemotaxis protein [Marinoscillum sp.]